MKEQALNYLERDTLAYADMLVPLVRDSADIIACDEHGVLIYERESDAYMLTSDSDNAALKLLDQITAANLLETHNYAAAQEAQRRFGMSIILTCHQAVWTSTLPPVTPPSPYSIRQLEASMAELVCDLYSHDIGLDYIVHRIVAGEMWSAFDGDNLVGFVGTHAEGSMGMLEVLPKYRRKGIGRLLAAHVCGVQLSKGILPYSQFTVSNQASRQLNLALGMSISSEVIYWLE